MITPYVRDLAGLRHLGAHDHEVVELQVVVVVEHHAERARGRVLGPEDPADLFLAHDASRSLHHPPSVRTMADIVALPPDASWTSRLARAG